MPAADSHLRELLNRIELREAGLLSWGLVDASWTEDELEEVVREHALVLGIGSDPLELIDDLCRQQLVFRYFDGAKPMYRSRSAEAVRLFARLTQLLPFHMSRPDGWRQAARLVADFRYQIRPRSYPERDQAVGDLVERVVERERHGQSRADALGAMLDADRPLAQFQVDAVHAVLDSLDNASAAGLLISAGTGSGKTLAVYLPALADVAAEIDHAHSTSVMAIYPRTELLRDQFAEVYRLVRRLDGLTDVKAGRAVLLGAFYGDTPNAANPKAIAAKWPAIAGGGWACPYLRCPECGGVLIWSAGDAQRGVEQLRCQECEHAIDSSHLVLTRAAMRARPPDVLFTSTESLNRQMSDGRTRNIFGIGVAQGRGVRLVLLDEVHTYVETAGAQVAYLLRRWRHASGDDSVIVGLSATLRNAEAFLAQLTGLSPDTVQMIEPRTEDLLYEGMEYLLALRHDPLAGPSVLSTTIQAGMLSRRILEPATGGEAGGSFGRRVFLFTDDLDVTNRLFYDLRDAEGVDDRGRRVRQVGSLANLRASALPDRPARFEAGQAWDLCEQAGHSFEPHHLLRITRTSSQDRGVDVASDAVVATASLDVGFDDPEVGLVLQHKAPHTPSQFVQRRGRAGRPRQMRPWTVVVLSDFGRDRLAYEGYDLLFDPALEPQPLPTRNRYVMRIQAVYAFFDWLSDQHPDLRQVPIWSALAEPPTGRYAAVNRRRHLAAAKVIREALDGGSRLASLYRHLESALALDLEELHAVCWQPPRALLTEAVPTMLRRLESGWRSGDVDASDRSTPHVPLPDFAPASLFDDLNVPEVRIDLPAADRPRGNEVPHLRIAQALREFAPGRVSKRYATRRGSQRHWMPLPAGEGGGDLWVNVRTYAPDADELGHFEAEIDGTRESVRCFRPASLQVEAPADAVRDSANSFPEWRTQLLAHGDPTPLDLPSQTPLRTILRAVDFYTHNRAASVEARRFAIGARASVSLEGSDPFEQPVRFFANLHSPVSPTRSGSSSGEAGDARESAAVGFVLDVDAIRVQFAPPDRYAFDDPDEHQLRASFRTAFFRHRVASDRDLAEHLNVFQRERLAHIYVAALAECAISAGMSTQVAADEIGKDLPARLARVASSALHALPTGDPRRAEEVDDADGSSDSHGGPRGLQRLLAACHKPEVCDALSRLAATLWEDPTDDWRAWAQERFATTLGFAVQAAAERLAPELDAGSLLVDIKSGSGAKEPEASVWLSEPVLGGGGIVEGLLVRCANDPRRFLRLLSATLRRTDFEQVDAELRQILEWAITDGEVSAAFVQVREAASHAQVASSFDELRHALSYRGAVLTHPVVAALSARLLRPGTNKSTDEVLDAIYRRWDSAEEELGFELDARIVAYLESASEAVDTAIGARIGGGDAERRAWRMASLLGVIWPRGGAVRSRALHYSNSFASLPPSERLLVLAELVEPNVVSLSEPDWLDQLTAELARAGEAVLVARREDAPQLAQALHALLTRPVEAGFLLLYPVVTGLTSDRQLLHVQVELPEHPV